MQLINFDRIILFGWNLIQIDHVDCILCMQERTPTYQFQFQRVYQVEANWVVDKFNLNSSPHFCRSSASNGKAIYYHRPRDFEQISLAKSAIIYANGNIKG